MANTTCEGGQLLYEGSSHPTRHYDDMLTRASRFIGNLTVFCRDLWHKISNIGFVKDLVSKLRNAFTQVRRHASGTRDEVLPLVSSGKDSPGSSRLVREKTFGSSTNEPKNVSETLTSIISVFRGSSVDGDTSEAKSNPHDSSCPKVTCTVAEDVSSSSKDGDGSHSQCGRGHTVTENDGASARIDLTGTESALPVKSFPWDKQVTSDIAGSEGGRIVGDVKSAAEMVDELSAVPEAETEAENMSTHPHASTEIRNETESDSGREPSAVVKVDTEMHEAGKNNIGNTDDSVKNIVELDVKSNLQDQNIKVKIVSQGHDDTAEKESYFSELDRDIGSAATPENVTSMMQTGQSNFSDREEVNVQRQLAETAKEIHLAEDTAHCEKEEDRFAATDNPSLETIVSDGIESSPKPSRQTVGTEADGENNNLRTSMQQALNVSLAGLPKIEEQESVNEVVATADCSPVQDIVVEQSSAAQDINAYQKSQSGTVNAPEERCEGVDDGSLRQWDSSQSADCHKIEVATHESENSVTSDLAGREPSEMNIALMEQPEHRDSDSAEQGRNIPSADSGDNADTGSASRSAYGEGLSGSSQERHELPDQYVRHENISDSGEQVDSSAEDGINDTPKLSCEIIDIAQDSQVEEAAGQNLALEDQLAVTSAPPECPSLRVEHAEQGGCDDSKQSLCCFESNLSNNDDVCDGTRTLEGEDLQGIPQDKAVSDQVVRGIDISRSDEHDSLITEEIITERRVSCNERFADEVDAKVHDGQDVGYTENYHVATEGSTSAFESEPLDQHEVSDGATAEPSNNIPAADSGSNDDGVHGSEVSDSNGADDRSREKTVLSGEVLSSPDVSHSKDGSVVHTHATVADDENCDDAVLATGENSETADCTGDNSMGESKPAIDSGSSSIKKEPMEQRENRPRSRRSKRQRPRSRQRQQ